MVDRRRSPWRFGVPLVCLLAGLLVAATHGVSGGAEIRRAGIFRKIRINLSENSRLASGRDRATTDLGGP